MKFLFISSLVLVGLAGCAGVGSVQSVPTIGQATGGPLTGTVERVWEDGFSINTGDRTVTVDAWDVCGDNTQQNVSVGDQLTVSGEFSALEFDASALTNATGESLCSTSTGQEVQTSSPTEQVSDGSLTGTVERVWEDGFEINTGDRSITVDTWDVCGDNTQQTVAVGEQLTVAGEFSGLEFDASALINAAGESVCS